MSTWAKAVTEFRQMLFDTDTNKRSTRKKILGDINGTNTKFRTYDKRLVESSVEVFQAGVAISFSVDDAVAGELTITPAPEGNVKLEASYYWTWWTDAEVTTYLNKGAEAVGQWNDNVVPDQAYLQIPPGLKTAAMYFAASMAQTSLIQYMQNRPHSSEFLVEQDQKDDANFGATLDAMRRLANDYHDKAIQHRDDFYKRLGKREAPAFGVKIGATRNYGPRR